MGDVLCLRKLLQKGDYICKLDRKNAYFAISMRHSSRNYLHFSCSRNLYDFLYASRPALRIFTKALKIIGEDKDSDNKIFGQKPTLAYDGRDSHFHRHYDFPPPTFGFCSKYEDVHFGSRRMS